MKHIVGWIVFFFVTIAMTGCYGNPGASYGSLVGIKFLDANGNDYDTVAYPNQSCTYEEVEATTMSDELTPLNSPAPGNYYFCVTIPNNVDVTVRFIIRPGKTYFFYSIDLDDTTIANDDVVVSTNGDLLYVDYILSKELIQEGFRSVSNLKMATNLEDDSTIKNGTIKPHANNSIKGIVIRFVQEEQTFTGLKQST